ncbi:molybdopterin molybdotransferase MoeA [Catellatospora bangladeshensis]|uniref:Molybdopterin molybdenumtransferase n=1 Tax=Catellatospora bangladeshensis TaxID=310355 RepID=A0A8J3JVK5_9ACTN|nr:molybdopterin molybdotransferase MoeA [Catellatospora bangladeshensis]GIF84514.1 molybdopterin molybdenumtransferase MoeA [Catellatospora bangladeshensis]
MSAPEDWASARRTVHAAGWRAQLPPVAVPLADADGLTLAAPLAPVTDLPAFPTASVDGFALRGRGPWRVHGQVLAGSVPAPLAADGTGVEIATGAMVPEGTEAILRVEHATRSGDLVDGTPKSEREWRVPGEEAHAGEPLLPVGTPVTPGVIGLAASCGLDALQVRPAPRAAMLIFGDELLTAGPPADGRIRDSLGPSIPAYLRRLGVTCENPVAPIQDTLGAHVAALRAALDGGADLICTTGGTMHGPVDHLHPALAELGAQYVVNTVAVRPGFPMLVAAVPHGGRTRFVAGLPGNPQSAVVALVSLVIPLLAGLTGRPEPVLPRVTLGEPVPGRGDFTHLALVRVDPVDGLARPVSHVGSAMLRGLAGARGFAVIPPGATGRAGDAVELVEVP